ncbi:inhibin beta A chain-like [Hemiscyllium ocellatum]|uniref:inhibin beta A chain-like n=1 Tax=Hemiscyllium ocellatum TaxID=170820 RepID=UPI002966AEC0|nr:inhibin beta A chain-like [Hemiscyllium ocellatum]
MSRVWPLLLLLVVVGSGLSPGARGKLGKWEQLEAVKRGILDSLGLAQPPLIRHRASKEEEQNMLQLFLRQHSDSNLSARSSSTILQQRLAVRVKTARDSGATTHRERQFTGKYTLSIARTKLLYPGLKVVRAELKFHKRLQIAQHLEKLNCSSGRWANVYRILEHRNPGGEHLELIDSRVIDSGPITTFILNVQPLIQLWVDSGQQQVQMQLELSSLHPDTLLLSLITDLNNDLKLEIETEELQSIRRARRATSSTEDCLRRQKNCCRKSLLVSFKEIGWNDWIRAPESYNMYNCVGSCHANYKPANMHAMIKSAMHKLSGGARPALCCNPATYEPMTLLHYSSEGKLTLTAFDNMIVTNCHCS